jgi:hypothetical protein
MAKLYDPVSMPPRLAKAHESLDRSVDRYYRKDLFALYEQLTAPLAVEKKGKKRKL